MPDLLVRLYALPDPAPSLAQMARIGVRIRRPEPWERIVVREWVATKFLPGWAAECDIAFATQPASCFVALEGDSLVGFACHDCVRRDYFGPTGVEAAARGRGIGLALLFACLHAMRDAGYAYAIIGGVGPAAFYEKSVGATLIEHSTPGIYDFGLVRAASMKRPSAPEPAPADASRCPLCGRPNGCAMAAGGQEPCWCASATISPETLAQIPAALRDVACLCAECATGVRAPCGD
jgi:hypothetical protein